MQQKKLYLLDAYALIYRAYYAFIRSPRLTSKGVDTSASFGFTNTLLDIIKRGAPSHLAVVMDYPGPTFRDTLFPYYKANREATPEGIKNAVPQIKNILEAMKIPLISIAGFEADDVMGTIACRASEKGYITYIVTPDKDLAQVVNDNIFIYKPRSGGNDAEVWGTREVIEAFQVREPVNVIDVLALWGDASDNIPGCPGIGEKKAKEIISRFNTIEEVYQNIELFSGKQKENLIQYRSQVELSKKLVTIHTNVPVEMEPEEFSFTGLNVEKLYPLLEELEFKTLSSRLKSENQASNGKTSHPSLFDIPPLQLPNEVSTYKTLTDTSHDYTLVTGVEEIKSLVTEIAKQSSFCFDTETSGLDVWSSTLVGIAISWQSHRGYYIPFTNERDDTMAKLGLFKPVLENKDIEKIGQNLKFDALVLKQYDINIEGSIFDTMIAHHLLQPGLRHNMDYLAEIYLNYRPIPIETLIGVKGKNQRNMRDVPLERIKDYAAEDADITFQLKLVLEQELKKAGLLSFFNEVEMPLLKALIEMEQTGVKLDINSLARIGDLIKSRLKELENEIKTIAGREFNLNSPRQVGEILFKVLDIDSSATKTKSGQYMTNEETLQKLKNKHPVINQILDYRGLNKLLSTYIETLPQLVVKKTGHLHTSYSQSTVVTGRLSSSNPNLQNIPVNDSEGREIRKAFTSSGPGHLFLSADYSQVELRLMAHFSDDPHMIAAFDKGEDIHAATAARIFNVPIDKVTPEMRRKAKTANFGIIYGISAFGLAERLNITRSEANNIIQGYFNSFPGVKKYMTECVSVAREKGYVQTLFGRRRYLPDINSRNAIVRGMAERNAINTPIQGTAADIIKKAMVLIHGKLKSGNYKTRMILQVHDELNFDLFEPEMEFVVPLIKECMENACDLKVPLLVQIGTGKNWLEAH